MTITTRDTCVSIPPEVLFRDLEGEAILLNTQTGRYFGLDQIGLRMWQSLAETLSVDQTFHALMNEFAVEPERLQQDLLAFVDTLCDKALLLRVAVAH